MSDGHSDEDLVRECLDGNVESFGELVRRHQRAVYTVVRRMVRSAPDAEDLSQTVFLKAYRQLATFDARRRFGAWLYGIAVHEALNHIRRAERSRPLDEDAPDGRVPVEEGLDDASARRVQEAVMALTPDYRAVVVLRHWLDLSYQDIGRIVGIPEKTVKSRLFTARRLLRESLEPDRRQA